jgi:hypothetical protein
VNESPIPEGKWGRPAAGREPAAAALLAWLADPEAPRLCLVTGGAGCGKSALLACDESQWNLILDEVVEGIR